MPTPPSCARTTTCSNAQCGTTIRDNCGNPLTCSPCPCIPLSGCSTSQCGSIIGDNCSGSITCPACPLPPPVGCTSTTTCEASQCGLTIFDNCNNNLACPACPNSPGSQNTVEHPTTDNEFSKAVASVTVTGQGAQPTQGVTQSPTSGPNVGMIAGVGGAFVVVISIAGLVYLRRGRNKDDGETFGLKMNYIPMNQSPDEPVMDLPKYQYTGSPDASVLAQTRIYPVTSVPGFYRAIVDHQPLKEGQLELRVDMRLYVTSIDKDGWCKALVGRQEGFVHADMLGPIG
ncbi:UNVERIFIED_CONTAM: hypothetical protein HDU68_011830 [Siphonaria sp. JEL0065]|nr:hypothetical protein HDU68_011830 [Siphonaria sp. JEL0065]